MGDRFYNEMLDRIGTCPGYRGTTRRRRMAWDDAKKAEAVDLYSSQEPTPETSMEIVKDVADSLGESPNGVRMILTRAGVYVKKAPTSSSSNSTGGSRVSKADAQSALSDAIQDAGQEIDQGIIDRLTGKAAVYFTNIITTMN
ncbi:uncharacterized protein METZ01_LOCUS251039 [marine metagenome]|uniref:Uncharacterized protein n=1 Tax=marine metagenome TaxID=408172 RepID=A0A382IFQ9_9ZZZZ